jgi:hypothetical protein
MSSGTAAGPLDRFDLALPAGTAALAVALAEQGADRLAALTGRACAADPLRAVAHLLLPHLTGDRVEPAPPVPVGGGAVHADLTAEDAATFERLRAVSGGCDAEALAAEAQRWRLPVTPYRALLERPASGSAAGGRPEAPGEPAEGLAPLRPLDLSSVQVLDLTAMWAGPLCTALLAEVGARVTTVEPACRPDGLRGSPGMFAALDRGKARVDLDLRRAEDRARFEALVGRADLLVESFSPRVLGNLGYGPEELHRLAPRLATVSIRAFPAGSTEEAWVAYGQGVHAASGLGMVDGAPRPAGFSYPDPLAGLWAFAEALAALAAPAGARRREVSLAGAVAPLARTADARAGAGDPAALGELRAAAGRPLLRAAGAAA